MSKIYICFIHYRENKLYEYNYHLSYLYSFIISLSFKDSFVIEPSFDNKEALFDKIDSFPETIESFAETIEPGFVITWGLSFFFRKMLNNIFSSFENGTSINIVPKKPKKRLSTAIET